MAVKNEKKLKYEPPVLVPLGEIAKGRGAFCGDGSAPTGDGPYCAAGTWANSGEAPGYCEAGTTAAPGYCTAGTTATTGCTDGVNAATCTAGTAG